MSQLSFSNKVVIVAGASRGIGAATAKTFALAGASVVVAARNEVALNTVVAEIEASGGRATACVTDVGDEKSAANAVAVAVETYGRLDYAFNNATDGTMPVPLADIDVDGFDRALRTNIRGTFLGMKFQIPAMLNSGGGAVVNMASGAGVHGVAGLGAYVAAKAGIIGLTECAALDYCDQGVRVNVVAPGPILTHHLQAAGAEAQRQAAMATPMGRVGSMQEVADAVLWLCSEQASYVTGITLPIDGGQNSGVKPKQTYVQGRTMQPEDVDR